MATTNSSSSSWAEFGDGQWIALAASHLGLNPHSLSTLPFQDLQLCISLALHYRNSAKLAREC
jgi:hypothetical protein